MQDPIPNIEAQPDPSNILEWHFVIHGEPDTPYAGGTYHGKLIFPHDYPFKPPGILVITPSGRFKPGQKICFSFSDFHPEAWNPIWHVATILNATQSFMNEESQTTGSVTASVHERRRLAAQSLANSCKNPHFRRIFPHLVERHEEQQREQAAAQQAARTADAALRTASSRHGGAAAQQPSISGAPTAAHEQDVTARGGAPAPGRRGSVWAPLCGVVVVALALVVVQFSTVR